MQKQTQEDIKSLKQDIARIEKIMLTSAGVLITGMAGIILVLITRNWSKVSCRQCKSSISNYNFKCHKRYEAVK